MEHAQDSNVLPDHIAMELDCLATLTETQRLEQATAFARQYLLRWLPTFVAHIEEHATLAFYRVWAKALQETLENLYPT